MIFQNSKAVKLSSEEVAGIKAHSGKYMFKLGGSSSASTTTIPIGSQQDNNFNLQFQALSKSYATSTYQGVISNPPVSPYSGNRYEYCEDRTTSGFHYSYVNSVDRYSTAQKGTVNRTFAVTEHDNGYDAQTHCETWELSKNDPNDDATMIKQSYFKPAYKGMHEFFINIRKHTGKVQFIIRKADRHQGQHNFGFFNGLPFTPEYEYLTSVYHDAGSPRLGCNASFFDTIQNIPVTAYLDDNLYYEVILIYIPNTWINQDCPSSGYNYIYARTARAWVTNFNEREFYHNRIPQANTICNYTAPIKADETMLNPSFKLEPGKKMLVSTWVREECTPPNCTATTYTNSRVNLLFTNSSNQNIGLLQFFPSGPIIDGWQKIEAEFTPPEGATNVILWFAKSGAGAAYFDDVRMHPFSANMKTYVYDPVSLLLKAELNENNYAAYYEYDEEGTLIRTKVETTEGVKTIRETRSAKQKDITTFNPVIY